MKLLKDGNFGIGAINKVIPQEILQLPKEKLKIFLDGYMSGDGCNIKDSTIYQATTISRSLAESLVLAIQKVYRVGCRIYLTERPKKHIIEGREVNQNNTYMVRFDLSPQKPRYVVDTNCIWYPIKKIIDLKEERTIYNITVEEDHTYTANNCYCFNCQDFSVAGKQAGGNEGSGTRSSLMYESIRIINKLKPKYVLWENVKNLLSKKHKPNFDKYIQTLDEMGYNSYYKVLNAKNYGIPQNRERVYTISIRKDIDDGSFVFPEEKPLTIRLKDILETKVDEKYYIKSERVSSLLSQLQESNQIKDTPCCCDSTINEPKVREISNVITARYDSGIQNQKQIGTAVVESRCIQVGELDTEGHDQMKRVSSEEGIAPTLITMGGGNTEPKVAQKIDYKGKEVELPCIGASRGRNPENPSDRTPGNYVEQTLEINTNGTTNTLTSVQKDNYVIEEVSENE